MEEHGYDARHVLPHGSYLINLGNPAKHVTFSDNRFRVSYTMDI